MFDVNKIRRWYLTNLGITIPETKLIEVPSSLGIVDLESGLLFVPPIRSWEEINARQFEETKKAVLAKLYKTSDLKDIPEADIKEVFDEILHEVIGIYNKQFDTSIQLRGFVNQHAGERVYVLPAFQRLRSSGLSDKDQCIVDSLLVHELLHTEQERRGLNDKFHSIKEGAAWTVQSLYGVQALGLDSYIAQFQSFVSRLNPTQQLSAREKEYQQTTHLGIQVLTAGLGIDLRGEPQTQLSKLRGMFDMPRYARMDTEVMYQYFKPKVVATLQDTGSH